MRCSCKVEPSSQAAPKPFAEGGSRDVLSILMITEICEPSPVTTLVGSVTHLNVCMLCSLCLCVHTCRYMFKNIRQSHYFVFIPLQF